MTAPPDVFDLTAQLVDIASESFHEGPLVEWLEAELRSLRHLEVTRVGDNLVARTRLGRPTRLLLGGHTDTVPANRNAGARIEGDVLWGVGAADMKGGLAVMLSSARRHVDPVIDLTYVFYAREEVASEHSGLAELIAQRPELVRADVALLGEPTDGDLQAGCQGSVRATITMMGERAHTARAWMGRNAIHRAAPVLGAIAAAVPRRPVISGCEFHEALQVVAIEGGVSGNVVPDRVVITLAHRFAPDRSAAQAEAHLRSIVEPYLDETDRVEIIDVAPAAAPAVDHPVIAALIARNGLAVTAKLGWTDVARLATIGIPAANFGPGDPRLAHSAQERITRGSIERTWAALDDLVQFDT